MALAPISSLFKPLSLPAPKPPPVPGIIDLLSAQFQVGLGAGPAALSGLVGGIQPAPTTSNVSPAVLAVAQQIAAKPYTPPPSSGGDIWDSIGDAASSVYSAASSVVDGASDVASDITQGAGAVTGVLSSVANSSIVQGALNFAGSEFGDPNLGSDVAGQLNSATGALNSAANFLSGTVATVAQVASAVSGTPLAGVVSGIGGLTDSLGIFKSPNMSTVDSAVSQSGAAASPYPASFFGPLPPAAGYPVVGPVSVVKQKIFFPTPAAWKTYASGNVGGLRG